VAVCHLCLCVIATALSMHCRNEALYAGVVRASGSVPRLCMQRWWIASSLSSGAAEGAS